MAFVYNSLATKRIFIFFSVLYYDYGEKTNSILLLIRLNCPEAAMRSLQLARQHASSEHERLVYEGWILYDTGHCEEGLQKAEDSISLKRSFEAYFLKAYALADSSQDPSCSSTVVSLLEDALKCPSDRLRKGQVWSLSLALRFNKAVTC